MKKFMSSFWFLLILAYLWKLWLISQVNPVFEKKTFNETVLTQLLDQLLFYIDSYNVSGLVLIIVRPLT